MGFSLTGDTINIVGIEASSNGRCCEEHPICGVVLQHNSLVQIRLVQITICGKEESALAVFWVTDGVDRCRVGFLPRYMKKNAHLYDGKLAQVTEFLKDSEFPSEREKSYRGRGVCRAALVEVVETPPRKRPLSSVSKDDDEDQDNKKKKSISSIA